MDNRQIIERARSGDKEAFSELCRQYYPSLLAYARLFMRGQWAEDIIQDVYTSVWIHRETLDPEQSVYGYFLRSVYNTAVNYMNHANQGTKYYSYRREHLACNIYSMYDPDANPVISKVFSADILKIINEAIEKLPRKRREVFRLNYVQGLSQKEISETLGLSIRTVEHHIFLALKQLRILIEKTEL